MASRGLRGAWLISMPAILLWTSFSFMDPSPAEARRGGFHGGSHAGFGGRFRAAFPHSSALHNGVLVNRTFVSNRALVGNRFFHHPFRRNVFFFNVGLGGFFPLYPGAYPYPAYYPYYYPYYSPCGYYDAYGRWVNAPCPPYGPSVSAPY